MSATKESGGRNIGQFCTTARLSPDTCPICQSFEATGGKKGQAPAMEAHIRAAHPMPSAGHPCGQGPHAEKGAWQLDWDVVQNGRTGAPIYFCLTCGSYAPDVCVAEAAQREMSLTAGED